MNIVKNNHSFVQKLYVCVRVSNKSAANSPVKPSAPAGPPRMVLAVPDEPARERLSVETYKAKRTSVRGAGRFQRQYGGSGGTEYKPVLRDELGAVVAIHRYPPERLQLCRHEHRASKNRFISLTELSHAFSLWLLISIFCGLSIDKARAQESDDFVSRNTTFDSPERFALELRIGPYVPDVNDPAFEETYRDDSGLMLGLELEVIAYRLKDILYLNIGGGFGYADYTGPAREVGTNETTGEEADFDMFPLSLKGVVRIDALARLLGIPFIFTGKLGYAWFIWDDEKGDQDIADGISHGLVWAGQLALDLDFFDRAAARMLDDEWGINHSFLFFEVYGVDTREGLELDEITWSAGLGFVM